jgi:citrate lyase subunit beta / citryl-CoA lyase
MLFVPGNRAARVEHACESGADAVVLDLEDSVPEHERESARSIIAGRLPHAGAEADPDLWVRTSPATSSGFDDDLRVSVQSGLTGIVLPQVDHPEAVRLADEAILAFERLHGLPLGVVALLPVAESALGIRNLFDILSASKRVRVAAFPGAAGGDLCASLGVSWTPGGQELLYARSKVLLDARAAGVEMILDSVWADIDDLVGLRDDSELSRRLGYTGRFAIHPHQLNVLHNVFTATRADVADAQALLVAYDDARRNGHGAIRHRGRLVDAAMAENARRLLATVDSSGDSRG